MPRTFKFDLIAKRLSELQLQSERVFSSRPYPVITTDAANFTVSVAGDLRTILKSYDAVDVADFGVAVTNGSLRFVIQTAETIDPVNFGVSIAGGELRTVLKTYTADNDRANFQVSVAGGQLKRILIVQDQPADPCDFGVSVSSGYLGP